jgi:hypothetical protein
MTLFFSAFFLSLCAKIFDNDERIIQEKCEDQLLMDTTEVFSSYVLLIRIIINAI